MKNKKIVVKKERLLVGLNPAGLQIEIPCYTLKGEKGPTFYLQSGIHGGEITYWIVEKLYKELIEKEIKGTIILIPMANPPAWGQRIYFTTAGKFDWYDGKDWNRHFPGNEMGSLADRVAYQLYQKAKTADFVIDLHTSRSSFPFPMTVTDREVELAKLLDFPYIYQETVQYKDSKYQGSLSDQMSDEGKTSMVIECGSHDSYEPKNVDKIVKGILRILAKVGMIERKIGQEKMENKQFFCYGKLKTYKAVDGGFIIFRKEVGENYKKGEVLFEIHNPADMDLNIEVKSEEAGIIQKISPTHIYWAGDSVMEVITTGEMKKI